jgi:MFS family permease
MNIIDFGILKERNSLLIFFSQSISAICDKMMSIGLIWYLTKHFSIEIVPWFLAISFLPHLVFSFVSTGIIHRFGALRVVVYSEFYRGIILLGLYCLLTWVNVGGSLFVYYLFFSMFLVGIGSSLFNPAILTLPPLLVRSENILKLNALIDTSFSVSTIFGAVFAVFLLQILEINNVILINAISFIFAGLLQLAIKIQAPILLNTENIKSKILSPLSIVKKFKGIARMLLLFFLMNLFLNPIFVLIPWFVDKIYLGESKSLAVIEGSMGLGAFIIGLFVSLLHIEIAEKNRVRMIGIITMLFGILFFVLSYSKETWQGAGIIFLIGALSTFLNIQVLTYFQTAVEDQYVPGIMTAVNLISVASIPISFVFTGFVFPHVNVLVFVKAIALIIFFLSIYSVYFLKDIYENQR